jgi:YfiH family protein
VKKEEVAGLALWQFDHFPLGQKHFVSGRQGGLSEGPLSSLNLSLSAGDNPENVVENRLRLANAMGVERGNLVFISQCHSSRSIVIRQMEDVPQGKEADALITDLPGLCICVMGADCVPVLAIDPVRKVVAAIHAGWRGTADGIVEKTLGRMKATFGCGMENVWVGIGPSISQEKYEVGEEVFVQFQKSRPLEASLIFKHDPQKNKFYPNLWLANELQAIAIGVPKHQIEVAGICTYSNPNNFFSARYFQNKTGRFAAGVMLE